MRHESGQFGSFDGLDNRRELMILLQRLPSDEARTGFLKRIVRLSGNGFAGKQVKLGLCDPVQAYWALVNITGVLGVDINRAARILEEQVSRQ